MRNGGLSDSAVAAVRLIEALNRRLQADQRSRRKLGSQAALRLSGVTNGAPLQRCLRHIRPFVPPDRVPPPLPIGLANRSLPRKNWTRSPESLLETHVGDEWMEVAFDRNA